MQGQLEAQGGEELWFFDNCRADPNILWWCRPGLEVK
jgi:hypothetical protein